MTRSRRVEIARRPPNARGIEFILAGGAGVGLGHVVRCAAIAVEARTRGWDVRAFLDGDHAARATWKALSGEAIEGGSQDWQASPAYSVAALDFPNEKHAWLERLSRAGVRSLLIDDTRGARRADWTLLPGLHHSLDAGPNHAREPADGNRLFCGARYAILPEAHRRASRTPLKGRDRVLLSLGGADPHRLTPILAPILIDTLRRYAGQIPATTLDVVLGAAYEDPGQMLKSRLEARGAHVFRALDASAMAERMRRARVAVIGFGTSLTELAWHGTPFLTVTHHESDRAPARDLEANGLGRVLGTASRLDPQRVERRIVRALLDREWLEDSSDLAYHMLRGGMGVRHLLERLEDSLSHRSNRATPDQLGGESTGGLAPSR